MISKQHLIPIPSALLPEEKSLLIDLYQCSLSKESASDVPVIEWKAHKKIPTSQKLYWKQLEKRGFRLGIKEQDKKILLLELGLKENQLEYPPEDQGSTNEQDAIELHKQYQKKIVEEINEDAVNDAVRGCAVRQDYSTLVEITRKFIYAFHINRSSTVSLARLFAESLVPNSPNSIQACLAVHYAHYNGHTKQEELAKVFICSMLKDVGKLFLNYKHINTYKDLAQDQKKNYWQHSFMSLHLIKKSGLELEQDVLDLIAHHHENNVGLGKPNGLGRDQVNVMTYYIGIVETTWNYIKGHYAKHQLEPLQCLEAMAEKKKLDGMIIYHADEYANYAKFLLKRKV